MTGDSFGSDEPVGPPNVNYLFTSFERIDMMAIDAAKNEATLRLRCHHPDPLFGLSVDPMYLILSGKAYLIWVEQHHPHEPRVAEIQAVLQKMTREEQNAALGRARAISGYGKVVEEAITAMRGGKIEER